MNTKQVRPVLIEITEPFIGCIGKNLVQSFIWTKAHIKYNVLETLPEYAQAKFYELVLISLDPNEKIEVGDNYYDSHNNLVLTATIQSDHNIYQYKKVIARQSHLPKKYIQRFFREHNFGKVEDIEIEMEEWHKAKMPTNFMDYIEPGEGLPIIAGTKETYYNPKLTNGFVTIVKKEPVQYSHNLLCNMQYYMEYCQAEGYVTPEDWLNKFKHYQDDKEPILYTEDDAKAIGLGAFKQGMSFSHTDFSDTAYHNFKTWFEANKKK